MSDSLVTDGNTKLTQHSAVLAPKSLRTKTFSRPDILNVKKSDHEIFLEKGLQTLKKGTFNQIDTVCQLNKYERVRYQTESKVFNEKEEEAAQSRRFRDERRQQLLDQSYELKKNHQEKEKTLIHNWKKTQKDKHDRQVRDIQYELAVRKIAELKKEKSRIEHAKDSDRGVEEFQKILKRSGLGGDDGSNQKMTVSYEDGESFINRLEETVQQKWPSNEEVSDFLTQLKDRTAEKRQARYEKERRKRRALIDQEK